MKRFLSAIGTFTERTAEGGLAYGALIMAGIIAYEVIARFAFNAPTVWAHDTTWMVFGVYAIMSGAYCLHREQHIRVDVLWSRLSPRRKAIADLATWGFSFIFIATLLWFSIPWAWHSFQIREKDITVFAPPLYPSKIFLVLGTFWLLVLLVVKFIRDLQVVTKKTEKSE
jgi:TRAP-type mannitol/chloroaromatic compound transport system permease small subunit